MSSNQFVLRCVLDDEQSVFRDVRIPKSHTLMQLHHFLDEAFSLKNDELASFYIPDADWNPLEEIPMIDFEGTGERTMDNCPLEAVLEAPGDRLLWIADLLNLRTFYIELVRLEAGTATEAEVLVSVGELPESTADEEMAMDDLLHEIEEIDLLGDGEEDSSDWYDDPDEF